MSPQHPIEAVVETLDDTVHSDQPTLRTIIEAFGVASFSSVMLAIAILLVSPLSGVPFFSSVCGLSIALVAGQGMVGRDHIWLPARLLDRPLKTDRIDPVLARIKSSAVWLDRITARRFQWIVTKPASRVLYGLCCVFGLIVPLLELVPFSSSLIGLSVSLISVGLLARDGIIACIGAAILPVAVAIPATLVSQVIG